jgi:hypothetical protein
VNELSSITEEGISLSHLKFWIPWFNLTIFAEQPFSNMIGDKCLMDFFVNLSEDEILEVHRKLKSKIDAEEAIPEILEEGKDNEFSEVEIALSKVSSVQQKIVKSQVDWQEYEKTKARKDTKRHSLAPNMNIPLNIVSQKQVRLFDQVSEFNTASNYQRMQSSSNSESERVSKFNKKLKKSKKRKIKQTLTKAESFSKIGSLNPQINPKNGQQMVVTVNTFDESKKQNVSKILTFSSNKKSSRKPTMSDLTDEDSESSDEDSELETPISKAKTFANKNDRVRQSLTSVSEYISNKHDISCTEEDSPVDEIKKEESSSSEYQSETDQQQKIVTTTDKWVKPTSDEKVDNDEQFKDIMEKNQNFAKKILNQSEPENLQTSDKWQSEPIVDLTEQLTQKIKNYEEDKTPVEQQQVSNLRILFVF